MLNILNILLTICIYANGNVEKFIYGGTPADIRDVPWQIGFGKKSSITCGGSIISKRFVLTAAHCIDDPRAKYNVIYGTHKLSPRKGHRVAVREVFVHPDYNKDTTDHDIAVLELAEDMKFSRSAHPIKLRSREAKAGEMAVVSGWGKKENGKPTNSLLKTSVEIVDRDACDRYYGGYGRISGNMICAGAPGKDACQGDSGGPLAIGTSLVGVVSWGLECASNEHPGVYTNVAQYVKFINWASKNSAKWTEH